MSEQKATQRVIFPQRIILNLFQDLLIRTRSRNKFWMTCLFIIQLLFIIPTHALDSKTELNQIIEEIDQVLNESLLLSEDESGLVKSMLECPIKKANNQKPFGIHKGFSRGKGQGMLFYTNRGDAVFSPYSGYIIAIVNNESHSTIMINHGAGIQTIMTGLDKVDASAGQRVYSGQRLGHVRTWGKEDPCLYFELKYNGVSVDPVPYMIN